jgi:hypothetical protein
VLKEKTLKKTRYSRKAELKALHKESEKNEREQILVRLRLPPEKRTHFLRKRFPWGGSAL